MVFIEVIIAIAFVFFLASILVSGINEFITMLMNKRGNQLKAAIRKLLDEADPEWGERFYNHPVIASMQEQARWGSVRALKQRAVKMVKGDNSPVYYNPSYIPSTHFAEVITDFLAGYQISRSQVAMNTYLEQDEIQLIEDMRTFLNACDKHNYTRFTTVFIESGDYPYEVTEAVKAAVEEHPVPAGYVEFKERALGALDTYVENAMKVNDAEALFKKIKLYSHSLDSSSGAQTIYSFVQKSKTYEELRKRLMTWYDDYMDRVSGWYKRKMQFAVLWISIITVVVLNLDALVITNEIYNDANLRESLVAAAEQYSTREINEFALDTTNVDSALQELKDRIGEMQGLGIPMGWNLEDMADTCRCNKLEAVYRQINVKKLFGLLLMVLAISMGAPFWFDVFNKFIKIRSTGAVRDNAPVDNVSEGAS